MQPVGCPMQGQHRLTVSGRPPTLSDVRRLLLWGFKSSHELLENGLGTLEREVMTLAWQQREISVREACDLMSTRVAYTTVMTTMDRLYKEGFLARRQGGRAFVYQAAASRHEIEHAVAAELVDSLLQRNAGEPLHVRSSPVGAGSWPHRNARGRGGRHGG